MNRKLPPASRTASQAGLAAVQVVAEIDGPEPHHRQADSLKPPLGGIDFAVLLFVAVLEPDELRRQRRQVVRSRRDDAFSEIGVEVLDLAARSQARGAVSAAELAGGKLLGAVEVVGDVVEHPVEMLWQGSV